jgi:hypothetical protein
VVERRDTGSFGNGVSRVTVKALGRQTWQGRPVVALESPTGTTLLDPDTANWVASVKGTTVLATFDPPLGYVWPITVGKTWTRSTRVTSAQGVMALQSTFTVDAHEEVTVPAGTFKVFRIRYADQRHENVHWWQPDLGLRVKANDVRYGAHPAGAGTRDSELISLTIAR